MNRVETFFLEIHASEHCNLKCAGCSHFSSLADEEYCDISLIISSLEHIMGFAKQRCRAIHIMGGEPLLFPQLPELMKNIRNIVGNDMNIELVTNGILLDKMSSYFWNTCCECNIHIRPTVYPIDVNYKNLEYLALKHGVVFQTYSKPGEIKVFKTFPLDLNGSQDSHISFSTCCLASKFLLLKRGKLYICSIVGNIEHFNSFFHKDLKVSHQDWIDIFSINSEQELIEKINQPIPFCRYCNVPERRNIGTWNKSCFQIEEWIK